MTQRSVPTSTLQQWLEAMYVKLDYVDDEKDLKAIHAAIESLRSYINAPAPSGEAEPDAKLCNYCGVVIYSGMACATDGEFNHCPNKRMLDDAAPRADGPTGSTVVSPEGSDAASLAEAVQAIPGRLPGIYAGALAMFAHPDNPDAIWIRRDEVLAAINKGASK